MKKILLLLSLLALPAAVFAQGTVVFQNTAATVLTTNDLVGHTGTVATGYKIRIGLYVGAPGSDPTAFSLVGIATNSGISAGRFGYVLTISGNNGVNVDYQVRAWTLASGLDYESANAAGTYKGVSLVGNVTPATGTQTSPNLFSSTAGVPEFTGQLANGFAITPPIPEPSSIALGLLGLGAVAMFRRRK